MDRTAETQVLKSIDNIYIYIYNVLRSFLTMETRKKPVNSMIGWGMTSFRYRKVNKKSDTIQIRCANIKAGAVVKKVGEVESHFLQ